jgi:hypothetical protein
LRRPFTEEHIIPFGLLPRGGDWYLPKASCEGRADITKRFEDIVFAAPSVASANKWTGRAAECYPAIVPRGAECSPLNFGSLPPSIVLCRIVAQRETAQANSAGNESPKMLFDAPLDAEVYELSLMLHFLPDGCASLTLKLSCIDHSDYANGNCQKQ